MSWPIPPCPTTHDTILGTSQQWLPQNLVFALFTSKATVHSATPSISAYHHLSLGPRLGIVLPSSLMDIPLQGEPSLEPDMNLIYRAPIYKSTIAGHMGGLLDLLRCDLATRFRLWGPGRDASVSLQHGRCISATDPISHCEIALSRTLYALTTSLP